MNTILDTYVFTRLDTTRTHNTLFSQKQTWYKEIEKARQMMTDGHPGNAHPLETGVDQNTDNKIENTYIDDNSRSPVVVHNSGNAETSMSVSGVTVFQPDLNNGNRVAAQVNLVSTGLVNGSSAGYLPLNNNPSINVTQAVLPDVEAHFRSELQIQNIQFVQTQDGLRIYFRDYRMNASDINKAIQKIRELLLKLGIQVSGVVVNGRLIEINNVNQEAS